VLGRQQMFAFGCDVSLVIHWSSQTHCGCTGRSGETMTQRCDRRRFGLMISSSVGITI
jgi:hypothetical protein